MSDDFPIESRFSLEARVGRGASGDVHRALDRATGRTVAVKRLLAQHDEPTLVDRFRREARLLSQIDDPHVVRYVAHGADRVGRPCLVVEWLDGEDVARWQKRQRLSIAEALDVARQAAAGLDALHRAGIVHRDVKPSNLFAVPREGGVTIKLIDLGIARAAGEATLTTFGSMVGTPFYMAPEQARGEERVTARADLFSLGAVLFELLCGRRAFPGDDVFAVLAKIVLAEPLRLRDVMPGAPPLADAVLRRALSKAPEDRFASAREMADAIAALPPWTPGEAAAGDDPDGDDALTRVAPMAATWERRVVTAVFAGFATHTRDEDLHVFESIAAEQGGAAHPTLGRRVIAVFGGARSTGDEAARAARAAVAAAERIDGIRIVIATGRALAGAAGLTGDLVEFGVRAVEGAAGPASVRRVPPPGAPDTASPDGARTDPGGVALSPWSIPVDDATADLLGEHFVIEGAPGARVLAGVRRAAAPPRTLLGRPTPCVGRERELGLLAAMFEECASEPVARAALVTGPAGIGKSRLRFELLARLAGHDAGPEVLLARGSPLAEGSAFGLLAPALRRLAGVLGGEAPAEQRRKLRERIGRRAPPHVAEALADMAQLPGEEATGHGGERPRPDAMVSGDRLRGAWIAWLDAETAERPVVIALEDVHRADLPSVSFLDAALRALPDRPLFVAAFARPEVHERFPALWVGRGVQEVRLGPLTPKAAERLVRAALGDRADREAVQRIVRRGEGNAFTVEELIRAEVEGAGETLPDTVLGMVQARLDALGPDAKRALRAASVFGDVFWRGGVAELSGDPGGALDRLAEAELISRRPEPALTGEEELVFRNALVREAAYAMIPDSDRQAAHRKAGAWLERAGEVDPVLLATHFERGGDLERAAGYSLRAALSALSANDFAGAMAHAERCVAQEGAGAAPSARRGRARLVQAEACRWRGEVGAAALAAGEAVALLPRGSPAWFHAARESIAANGRLGQFDRVEERAEEVLAQGAFEGAAAARIAALLPAGGHLFYAGKIEAAAQLLARIEGIAAAASGLDPAVAARLHQLRALFADRAGDLEAALAHHSAALDAFEAAGDARGACQSLSNVGFVRATLGAFAEAEAALRAAHAGAERMGLGTASALALHNLGGVLAALGRLEEGRDVEARAVAAFAAAGDPRLEGASRVYLSRILLSMGDPAGAEAEARRVAESPASPAPLRAGARAALALALLASGRPDEALSVAVEAADALSALGSVEDFEALIGIAHAEALDAAGRHEAAKAVVTAARRRLLARAARLGDPARTRFLEAVPDNARCLGLAAAWAVGP